MNAAVPPPAQWLNSFVSHYNQLNAGNLARLGQMYDDNIQFIDPLHQIDGLEQLTEYFDHLYQNLISCHFELEDSIIDGDNAAIYWTMTLQHKKLKGGQSISLQGHSKLVQYGGKVIYHRDYFDLGAMLYQHIPVLGRLIRTINRKAAS